MVWPTAKAFEEAAHLISLLPLCDILPPKIYLPHDGEINFLWKQKDHGLHVDLGLYGDGTYSYYATSKDGEEFMDDSVMTSQGLPQCLIDLLAT